MDILDDMGVSKLLAKVLLKVNYSFNFVFVSEKRGNPADCSCDQTTHKYHNRVSSFNVAI